MLEKNKDYIEFSMRSMMATHRPYQDDSEIAITGLCPGRDLLAMPFDIPCDVVVIPKRAFERLQTENEELKKKLQVPDPFAEYKELFEKLRSKEDVEKFEWTLNHICGGRASVNGWMVTAKVWRRNYETLSKLVGFSSAEEIEDYLTNEVECDTLHEAILKLIDENKYACEEWCSANSSNNSWKAAAECNSPKEFIEKREALEKEIAQWKAITKCETPEAAETWMRAYRSSCDVIKKWRNETDCPSPSAAGALLRHYSDEVDKWQKAAECNSPKELMAKLNLLRDTIEHWHDSTTDIENLCADYRDQIKAWKEVTEYSNPELAKTLIESGMSWHHAYNELKEQNQKLADKVKSWQNVTGYSTPESYLAARINNAIPFDYTAAWKKATGCNTPEEAKSRIEGLENVVRLTNKNMLSELDSEIDEWQKFTGCDSPQEAGCKINNLCDEICKLKGDYDHLLKLTGYKSEHDICVALNYSEQFVYETMRELINSLKRNAKFIESNWQHATGCDTPEAAEKILEYYKRRLGNAVQAASCATKHLENITNITF